MLVDTHAHIQFDSYDSDRDAMIKRAVDNGVKYIICPGIEPESNERAIKIAEKYENVFATVGVHPHDCENLGMNWLKRLEEQAKHPKVVALGEMGLDYFKEYTPREMQRNVFRAQLELASSLDLPVVVHNRDSDDDVAKLMTNHGGGKGVLHCFASDLSMANRMVREGYLISFTGIATFNNKTVIDTIKGLQLNYMMVETDSPFLAPVPVRGKTNEPAYVRHIAEKIAELKNTTIQEVERITTHNAAKLFSLPV